MFGVMEAFVPDATPEQAEAAPEAQPEAPGAAAPPAEADAAAATDAVPANGRLSSATSMAKKGLWGVWSEAKAAASDIREVSAGAANALKPLRLRSDPRRRRFKTLNCFALRNPHPPQ